MFQRIINRLTRPRSGDTPWLNRNTSYPFNFDASERYMRLPTGIDEFPFPPIIGAMQPFYPMQDMLIYQGAFGEQPYGPGTTETYTALMDQFNIIVPQLAKQVGSR